MMRERIWKMMVQEGIAAPPFPPDGRIPNFWGSDRAAKNLDEIPEYKDAKVILAAPDYVLFHARLKCLKDRKTLLMATPRLKEGYLLLDPELVKNKEENSATIAGAYRFGTKTPNAIHVDFVIEGCVAVDRSGNRLGKGGGYGDLEISRARRLNQGVKVAVICSSQQVLERVPTEESDEPIDYIVTESGVICT